MTNVENARAVGGDYLFDNAWQGARERLALVEATFDPGTIRHLEALGIAEGWSCLEVGAGGGSIADWLCRRVGPEGRVVATDIETGLMNQLEADNLEVRESDIATSPPERAAFDLVHARLLLQHVPDRAAAMQHMCQALKPGGWLLLEDFDHVSSLPATRSYPDCVTIWPHFLEARRLLMEARGADFDIGRYLPELLDQQGLVSVEAEAQAVVARGGSAAGRGVYLTNEQIRTAMVATGVISDDEVQVLQSMFQDPSFTFIMPLMFAAWGQRPPFL